MKTTALIMAGGRGERFWPKSRKALPKQFLSLTDNGRTMIQLTVDRIKNIVDMDGIFVATNKNYRTLVREQLPQLPEENIICEPVGRNTSPCIGLVAMHAAKKFDDAIMVVLPSDHLVKDTAAFQATLKTALCVAQKDENLVTVGITPNYPETGYGYIKVNKGKNLEGAFQVERFVEKPNIEKAREYLSSGDYLWNSGMFVWKASSILLNIKKFLPETYSILEKIQATIGSSTYEKTVEELFPTFESISIDYGVMEKASGIYSLPGNFGWDDVGSWLSVERIRQKDETGSVVSGNVMAVDCADNIIQGGKKLIAAVGVSGLVVVDTEDAILICNKESCGNIKKLLEKIREQNLEKYL